MTKQKQIICLALLLLGIILRYLLMAFGYNYDFASYCIVGEIAGNFRNVYAETYRYNYAPFFFVLQGLLYRIAQINPERWVQIYRVMIVTVLTVTDLGIASFIATRYSYKNALVFFLNPVSIIITGYHNQFDNIAVFFALQSIRYVNEDRFFNMKDFYLILYLSLSLLTKHIMFMFPVFILFMSQIPIKKRLVYSVIPPVVFLMSFIPFVFSSDAAFQGVLNNVFRYRSFNNAPLLVVLYKVIKFPTNLRFIVYGIMMFLTALMLRKLEYEYCMFVYLIAMVAFSSSIANQYLVIPMAALCVLNVSRWDIVYMLHNGLFLLVNGDGLYMYYRMRSYYQNNFLNSLVYYYDKEAYIIAAWILVFALLQLRKNAQNGKPILSCNCGIEMVGNST